MKQYSMIKFVNKVLGH